MDKDRLRTSSRRSPGGGRKQPIIAAPCRSTGQTRLASESHPSLGRVPRKTQKTRLHPLSVPLLPAGYGHTVPLSEWGKIFCLFYAAVGIPVTLLFLADLLRLLVPLLSHWPVRYLHARWGLPLGPVAVGHAVALGLATLGLFILLPAIGFWAAEDRWSFLESVYFCFISLSTIGFGNHVPSQGNSGPPAHVLYELSITCYLLVGLLAMAATLETAHQLREVRAVIQFFAPARNPVAEDRQDILPRDQLALATVSRPDSQEEPVGGSAT
uniref:Potassium channel subfamily K member 7 n=1 Tax=Pogona vitticeps TaxID=103695 RepID=A0ABM5F4X1_9SAUR